MVLSINALKPEMAWASVSMSSIVVARNSSVKPAVLDAPMLVWTSSCMSEALLRSSCSLVLKRLTKSVAMASMPNALLVPGTAFSSTAAPEMSDAVAPNTMANWRFTDSSSRSFAVATSLMEAATGSNFRSPLGLAVFKPSAVFTMAAAATKSSRLTAAPLMAALSATEAINDDKGDSTMSTPLELPSTALL